jgi:hypothetical protein
MLQTKEAYEQLIYDIADLSEYVRYSDLVVIPYGNYLRAIKGNIYFDKSIHIEIREALDFALDEWITGYSYSVYLKNEKLYWYDSQGHPDEPNLRSTHPHHKHVPPDIKHNRIPAPHLSFKMENLTFLIHEVEDNFFKINEESNSK